MMKRSPLHCLRTHSRVIYPAGLWHRARTRRWWRTRGMLALVLSGVLLITAAVLGMAGPSRDARTPMPHVVHQTQVVLVKDDTLPPVMQRIAQCESSGQHVTKHGKVVRGKRNPSDTGLFQINTVFWGKKAQELGYNLHTPEGNEQMARYLFAHYGSVPWQSSFACWNRVS
jgi:hypothetical protein